MIVKNVGGTLYIFEKTTGMTGTFSGGERDSLLAYARTGTQDAFIDRLFDLGILVDDYGLHRIRILEAGTARADLPESLHIELTDRCPLSCFQCYKGMRKSGSDMSFQYLRELVDEADRLGVFQLAFGGGEPLSYPRIVDAVALVGHTGMSATVTTSGAGLSAGLLRALRAAGLNHMQVSLNSLDAGVNARSRDGYDEAIAALDLLRQNALSFGINWTARRENIGAFAEIASYAADLGADNVNILRYKPSPGEDYDAAVPEDGELWRLACDIAACRLPVKIKVDSAFSQLLCYLHGERAHSIRCGCAAGTLFVAVTPFGRFKPCSHVEHVTTAGSIEAYLDSAERAAFLEIRNDPLDLCAACLHKPHCGGCAAICQKRYGAAYAREKSCIAFQGAGI